MNHMLDALRYFTLCNAGGPNQVNTSTSANSSGLKWKFSVGDKVVIRRTFNHYFDTDGVVKTITGFLPHREYEVERYDKTSAKYAEHELISYEEYYVNGRQGIMTVVDTPDGPIPIRLGDAQPSGCMHEWEEIALFTSVVENCKHCGIGKENLNEQV